MISVTVQLQSSSAHSARCISIVTQMLLDRGSCFASMKI